MTKFSKIFISVLGMLLLAISLVLPGWTQTNPNASLPGQSAAGQRPGSTDATANNPNASRRNQPAAAAPTAVTSSAVLTSSPAASAAMPSQNPLPPTTMRTDANKEENKPAAYRGPVTTTPKPIVVEKNNETLNERMERMITLDVREMNVLDVLKFLALKGDFNMVTGNQVTGRVTLYLKNVKVRDALEIIVISNTLAYYIEKDIIYILSDGEYFTLFGKHFNEKNAVKIVQLKYAKPSYVLATLDSLKSTLGKVIIDEDTGSVVMIDTPESLEKMSKALLEVETPLVPVTYALQYAKADVMAEKLKARIDAHAVGSITVDERSNKLIVRALPERRDEIAKLIKEMDAPTKEVLVDVRVMQVVFKPQMDYGIDWAQNFGKLNFKNVLAGETTLPGDTVSPSGITGGLNTVATTSNLFSNFGRIGYGVFNVDDFALSIRALKQVSDTRILSNPRLLVTNNEEAKIHVGDTVPYIIATVSGTGDNAITSEDVRFVDVGVKINITPTINDDGFVTMRLNPEISTVTSFIQTKNQSNVPQVNKTVLESTIMVKDGMTIILGGLKKENKIQSKKGIPVLMNIPYLKYLFGNESESVEATEIVIFITPHIIKGDEDYRKLRGTIKAEAEYNATDSDISAKVVSATKSLGIKE